MMNPIRIFLADDFSLIRNGLRAILTRNPEYKIVGEAGDGVSAVSGVQKALPDMVLMDISMPTLDGIAATKLILKDNPEIKVIILSMHTEHEYAIEAFRAGARGYVLKSAAAHDIMDSIERVQTGERYASPEIAELLLSGYFDAMNHSDETNDMENLTSREKEVLRLIALGNKNKDIADKLFISLSTVKTHRVNLMRKLDIHNITGLIKFALAKGIIND
ncbi:MAG: response regulator transcription factor [Deltaproteobacteria bacterium]|nr:response regulator transcription factor [Deltaproteobacteria bacterium]